MTPGEKHGLPRCLSRPADTAALFRDHASLDERYERRLPEYVITDRYHCYETAWRGHARADIRTFLADVRSVTLNQGELLRRGWDHHG